MKRIALILVLNISLVCSTSALADDAVSVNSKKLSGKTQSECVAAVEQGLKDAGFSEINRGKNDSGNSRAVFGSDKPYSVGALCDGDIAFFYVKGPDLDKAGDLNLKFKKILN